MKELNELTKRLLAEGYTPEDTLPGTWPYKKHEGGWTHAPETRSGMTFETPCGLLVPGSRFNTGYMSFMGIDWRTENDNPVVCCPRFELDFCAMRHPMLWNERYVCRDSEIVRQCACHQTDRPYTYEGSLEEAHDRVWAEAEALWKEFETRHKGRVCKLQSYYNRTTRTWSTRYDALYCAKMNAGCAYCPVLNKKLDSRLGNVFYDVKETRTIKGDWLFPDKEVTTIRKGIKALDKSVSLTRCDAIVRYGRHEIIDRFLLNHHRELFFDKSLRYELVNFRAARQDTRDIMQDLADAAAGIEVIHQKDAEKFATEQKRARKKARLAQRVRSLEKLVLTGDLDDLTYSQRNGLKKHLSEERIAELMEQRSSTAEQVQTCLFG